MILPLITHLCFSEGPSTQARFPWIWLSMLDAISWESKASRTDSFTLNINRLPGISTLSY